MIEEIREQEDLTVNNEQQKQKDKKSAFKCKRVKILAALVVILGILGLYFYNRAMTYVSTDDAFVEGHTVRVSSKVSGNIDKVYIDDNQKVKKGELIAEIDSRDYKVKYEQAVAKLQAASARQKGASVNVDLTTITSGATFDQASSGVDVARSNIFAADEQINQAQANLAQINADIEAVRAESELAQKDLERYQKLYKQGAVSKQDFDKTSTNYKTVNAKLNAYYKKAAAAESAIRYSHVNKNTTTNVLKQALAKLQEAGTGPQLVSISDSQLGVANAETKQLEAAVKQAKLDLSYTKIYAPQSGSIAGKSVEVGNYVQIGQPLVSIVPDKMWVVANFKETQLTNMRVGQTVNIKVDAYPHKIFKGHIDSIQSSTGAKTSLFPPENAVGSFVKVVQRVPVKIIFDEKPNADYIIVPGMSVIPEVKVR